MTAFKLLLLTLILLSAGCLFAQSLFVQKNLSLESSRSSYKISDTAIIHYSESVWADSLLLINGLDYTLDYRTGLLNLIKAPDTQLLRVEFILIPPGFIQPWQSYQPRARSDSLFSSIKKRTNPLFTSDAKLDVQGSKTFAITFSDDQAFDLKQSLYVNLSGELAKGVSISAQLSDSQSKLSPEGDSKELSSLDRVFIKVYGAHYELAMGDLDLKYEGTRYLNYSSKFEGVNAWYSNKHAVQAAYSAGSGKSASITIPILDGKQGPYFLKPNDYQPGFIVVAGSEEIYVDGSLWERGMDYSIDYTEGSIMFKRLVSATNSVLARFHYADEFYPISSYLTSSMLQISEGLSLKQRFIWQQDDGNNPLLYDFSASDRDSLALAGDSEAWGQGISVVEAGSGDYIQMLTSTGIVYYEYTPGDSLANYNIVFSYVGFGNGDYQEFSTGKFRYTGQSQGSWLPQKRLLAPIKKGNLDFALNYDNTLLKAGIEILGSLQDRNTMSNKDDADNAGAIVYGFAEIPIKALKIKLDHEQRSAATYLFGQYRDPNAEYDFASLVSADSLAQQESNLLFAHSGARITASLLLRYKDIYALYSQKALRFQSALAGRNLLPTLNWRSTISEQDYDTDNAQDGTMQYHQGDVSWLWRTLKLRLESLYNLIDNTDFGSSYLKLNPSFSFGKPSSGFTQISYSGDETRLKNNQQWAPGNKTQTYAWKQILNSANHRLDFDWTHRELQAPPSSANPKSSYDLINLRSNHSVLKQALSFYANYQLNQTEFFAKIRELQYVGNGLGLYDSTGVSIPNGNFDYVFITSPNGTLSTETNAIFTLYLKPGNYFKHDFMKRLQLDSTLNLNEQSAAHNDWRSYLFWPGTVYNESSTIFGRQNLSQTLWLDIVRNHITSNLQLSFDRNLDKRYQTSERSYSYNRLVQMDIKGYNAYNTRLQYNFETAEDSRYASQSRLQSLSALVQRNLGVQTNLQAELLLSQESGGKQDGSEGYKLGSISLAPSVKSVWMQKYRISAGLGLTRNILSGSNYFAFLPNKREGWIPTANASGIYRINSYSSISLDYRFTDYPAQTSTHELKLEFKAEL